MSSNYISVKIRRQLSSASDHRCSYCRSSELIAIVPLEVEHIIPRKRGGKTTLSNLCLACRRCNIFKTDQIEALDEITGEIVPLFNPRTQNWPEHFKWSRDGFEIIGITPCGRATVKALQMNRENTLSARQIWVTVGLHPPID